MARIENHKHSIEEAFRECFYIVPDYQREYVWTDKEVLQLLEDIGEQIDAGTTREYFIGTVLVSPTDQKNHYEVIDGQQRLTTFFLLLCALRHLLQQEPEAQHLNRLISDSYTGSTGIVTRLKLDPRYESAAEVMAKVVKINSDPEAVRSGVQASGIASFGSLENLINAYSTLYRYLKDNYDDAAKLKKYWFYLATNVVFIQISTDVSSALKIFETINERGVGLNPMDLLKNLLFTQVKQAQFTQLKDEWKKITKPLFDHFVAHSWRASSSTTSSPRHRPRIWNAASPNGPTSCARLPRPAIQWNRRCSSTRSLPSASRRTWRANHRSWPTPSSVSRCTQCSSTARAICWRA